ncbi:MAG: transferase [Magnetococcales bacterium]|nr:transferase [Magnetococcales bacterium]
MEDTIMSTRPFTEQDCIGFLTYGRFHAPAAFVYGMMCRLTGKPYFDNQIRLSCYSELPLFFLKYGVKIAHPYGITLSVDRMGAACHIGQNVTIGANLRNARYDSGTAGQKPRLGNLVMVYAGAVISGRIEIGDQTIVAANAVVTKDIPGNSIVYGLNQVKSFERHHYRYLAHVLYHAAKLRKMVPGLIFQNDGMYVDEVWANKQNSILQDLIHKCGD